eukprot:TRINITY_DN76137_c0_g1_i1.p1 TRINITY_DN76137_c0_g1~~TRINITY_DN76137_c0_g1_i1.p1  ORF type:complete len:355 (+),score=71.73 TRINITY_DN76137_c0_g1_i1:28-1065(+)
MGARFGLAAATASSAMLVCAQQQPSSVSACSSKQVGEPCEVSVGRFSAAAERRGACTALMPSEAGVNIGQVESQLVCLACGSSASTELPERLGLQLGRLGTWGVFAAGAAIGMLFSSCLFATAWQVRRSVETPFRAPAKLPPSMKDMSDEESLDEMTPAGSGTLLRAPRDYHKQTASKLTPAAQLIGADLERGTKHGKSGRQRGGRGRAGPSSSLRTLSGRSPKASEAAWRQSSLAHRDGPEFLLRSPGDAPPEYPPCSSASKVGLQEASIAEQKDWDSKKWTEMEEALDRDLMGADERAGLAGKVLPSSKGHVGRGPKGFTGKVDTEMITDQPQPSRRAPRPTR